MNTSLQTVCRTCMCSEAEFESIFIGNTRNILNTCFQLQINENDGLSNTICRSCLYEVEKIVVFGEKCKTTTKLLKGMLDATFGGAKEDAIKIERNEIKAELICEAFILEDDDDHRYSDSESQVDAKPITKKKIKRETRDTAMYECDKCNRTMKTKKSMKRHFRLKRCKLTPPKLKAPKTASCVKRGNGQFECNECGRRFQLKQSVIRHFAKLQCQATPHVTNDDNINCEKCGLQFSSARGLKFHQINNKCGDVSLLCKICNCIFSSRKALRRHSYIHENIRYDCDLCPKSFIRPDLLLTHRRKEHEESYMKDAPNTAVKQEEKQFECHICKTKLKSRLTLHRHCLNVHKIMLQCEMCGEEFDSPRLFNSHMQKFHGVDNGKKVKAESLECGTCGKQFKNKFKFKEHCLIHTDERPHLCLTCGLGFKAKTTLRFHEMRHVGIKPFKCDHDQCTRGYYTQKDLKAHKRVHSGIKPYRCKECGKSYTRSDSLTSHLRVHSGERNHPCEFCPKRFLKRDHLRIHTRIHTGEKPFACSHCGQRFTQKFDMIKHERRHQESQPVPMTLVEKTSLVP